tara:strand:- start:454 stop:723 length:270 start_codon:yes stop_codon:yes gene_type:complete
MQPSSVKDNFITKNIIKKVWGMTQTELYEVAMEPIVLTAKQEEVIKRSRSNRKKKDNNFMMNGSVDKADSISHVTCGSTKSYPKLCRHH